MTRITEILRDSSFTAQADAINKSLRQLCLGDKENFLKYLNSADIWGGSGAAWASCTNVASKHIAEKRHSHMTKVKTPPIIEFKTAKAFETWLVKNHDSSNGLWLKIFKKDSGRKTISYAEALDVALCYGWIDGQKQAHDEQAWLQKFCPRSAKSIWSKINTGHVERLISEGRMKPAGLNAVEKAKADGSWERHTIPKAN